MPRSLPALLVALLLLPAGPAAAEDALRLYVFDCGTMRAIPAEAFLPGVAEEGERIEMVNRCYLVRHPRGDLLWDAGFPDSMTGAVTRALMWARGVFGAPQILLEKGLVAQLEELGVAPADVEYLALSHTHFDHVGNANAFAGSLWLVPRAEHAAAFSPERDVEYFEPELIEALRGAQTRLLGGDHDVFGDGTVVLLSAPGHTEGHQCLFLDLPETGPVVLSGDLYHTPRNRELRVAPSFNYDGEETLRSMERIEAFARERGAQLWIQHSAESQRGVPLAPQFVP